MGGEIRRPPPAGQAPVRGPAAWSGGPYGGRSADATAGSNVTSAPTTNVMLNRLIIVRPLAGDPGSLHACSGMAHKASHTNIR
jgi:hypothetical protein